jgi:hypothetical protein
LVSLQKLVILTNYMLYFYLYTHLTKFLSHFAFGLFAGHIVLFSLLCLRCLFRWSVLDALHVSRWSPFCPLALRSRSADARSRSSMTLPPRLSRRWSLGGIPPLRLSQRWPLHHHRLSRLLEETLTETETTTTVAVRATTRSFRRSKSRKDGSPDPSWCRSRLSFSWCSRHLAASGLQPTHLVHWVPLCGLPASSQVILGPVGGYLFGASSGRWSSGCSGLLRALFYLWEGHCRGSHARCCTACAFAVLFVVQRGSWRARPEVLPSSEVWLSRPLVRAIPGWTTWLTWSPCSTPSWTTPLTSWARLDRRLRSCVLSARHATIRRVIPPLLSGFSTPTACRHIVVMLMAPLTAGPR